MTLLHSLVERLVAQLEVDSKIAVDPIKCDGYEGILRLHYPRSGNNCTEFRVIVEPWLEEDDKPDVGDISCYPIRRVADRDEPSELLGQVSVMKVPRGWYVTTIFRNSASSCYVPDHNHEMDAEDFDIANEIAQTEFAADNIYVGTTRIILPEDLPDRYNLKVTEKKFMELKPGLGQVARHGLSRTIIGHLFVDPKGRMEEIACVVHHRSDNTWMVEYGEVELDQVNIRHFYLTLAEMGYRRMHYQVMKANIETGDDHPDLYPFGCEYSWRTPAENEAD